ncbi:S-layer homology domain-containing protein [Metasolibacillus sp. FSL H7-0170]|uniref:S-layer homology domain-containing protein n=1 Tax=Metasolibacillus sp. FSL H7-0170 TaxID=2921431 RepID=UPI00079C8670|nr:Parasporal protein [[Bacillus] sp. KCTC 13219]
MKRIFLRLFSAMLMFSIVFGGATSGYAFQTTNDTYPLSQGVKYSNYTYTQSKINHLQVDLSNPYTKLTVGLPSPINSLLTTTDHANRNSKEGNRVVGAINSNFFNMGDGYPLYLLSQNNAIVTPSVISSSSSNYVSQPIAFGITANGNAEIAYYNSNIIVNYKGEDIKVSGLNVTRGTDQAVIYTPQHHSSQTPNGGKGMEFVVETGNTIGATRFGQTMAGKVTAIRGYDDEQKAKIPRNGFVLSFNGSKWGDKFRNIKVGDDISVTFSIDDRWMDAQFMMASGPLLVLDGKVNLTMDANSSRAKEIAPRTAVAISKDKKTVHLITVDGRQGSSNGMTLTQFANYLVRLGVDRAINLDGGGSTAMGIRKYGSNTVVLANSPSGGSQRRVSAILQAVSTGATGTATTMKVTRDQVGSLLVGASVKLTPEYVLDEHYNPLPVNASNFAVTAQNGLVSVDGLSFTGVSAGSERVTVTYGNAAQTMAFNVLDAPVSLKISAPATTIDPGASLQLKATATGQNNENLIYAASQLEWSVDSEYGTISQTGLFKSNGKLGKALVSAKLGTKTVTQEIDVKQTFTQQVFAISNFEKSDEWRVETALTTAKATLESSKTIGKQGNYSMKLTYDMTGNKEGTAAAYLRLNSLIQLPAEPIKLGVWVYGDGNGTWVRGQIRDVAGGKHTIDFTEENGQTWTGWKYIEADIPKDIPKPISLESIYIVQPTLEKQKAGTLYFDKLQAIYSSNYEEAPFTDISVKHNYKKEIQYLVEAGLINGYGDGSFKPEQALTRAHAAVLLTRALDLDTKSISNPGFKDVATSHPYYKEIAAIVNAGIMNGTGQGIFDPNAKLTRAQMAKILVMAYDLKGTTTTKFKDVSTQHWSYDFVHTLAANKITTGYEDNTFKPGLEVSRVHFSLFLYRTITK